MERQVTISLFVSLSLPLSLKSIKKFKLKKSEISNLLDKEFKVMVIRTLTKLGRRMDGHNENLNKEKYEKTMNRSHDKQNGKAEEYNTLNWKILQGFQQQLDEAEERTSELLNMVEELSQSQ